MKKHIRILSTLMALMLIISIGLISVSAEETTRVAGDVIAPEGMDIMDATFIQRCIAQLDTMDEEQAISADVDNDNKVTIFDATTIQKELLNAPFDENGEPHNYCEIVDFVKSNLITGSGKVYVVIMDPDGNFLGETDLLHAEHLTVFWKEENDYTYIAYSIKDHYTLEKSGDYQFFFYNEDKAIIGQGRMTLSV
ncbi:MAG: dockerin type I repeat-containing protein [Ruminococcus sp.]|nr:dockerin type I repeat-containing protein [Ruminococcus sp.]